MSLYRLAELTWEEVAALPRGRAVAILPVGATEAHGPHLPLATDVVIAEGMAESGAERLAALEVEVLLLPALAYTPAPFAAGFPGTLSIQPETLTALVVDIVSECRRHGFERVVVANAHFDPASLGAIRRAIELLGDDPRPVIFPDVTRRRLAERLTEEFRSGACHAGRYEGSLVAARTPHLVRSDLQAGLPEVPVSLVEAMRSGQSSFEAAGARRAYCGDPAAATADEGEETYRVLGQILAEVVLQDLPPA